MLISTPQIGRLIKRETIWCFVTEEAKTPIVLKRAHKRIRPRYPEITWLISMCPQKAVKIGIKTVGLATTREVIKAARDFPVTTLTSVIGRVIKVSREPLRFSSAKVFIVMIGMKTVKRIAWKMKRYLKSALL